ncbi:MAG TPA: ABC transporter permease [Candidatus Polarisedimenticolaceae bacterium]
MSHLQQAALVARWEFRRYFKWKDQLLGILFFLVVSAVLGGALTVAGARGRTIVVSVSGVALEAPAEGRFRFVPASPDRATDVSALREGEIQGILSRDAGGAFELVVEKDPRYRVELAALLHDVVRRERLAEAGLAPETLARIVAEPPLAVRFLDPSVERRGKAEKIAAGVFIGVFLTAAFTSMAYVLTGITGEKQLRVTESVLSAIPPQAWIDGKIVGIAAYSLVGVANMAVGSLLVFGALSLTSGFALPAAAVRPSVLVTLVATTILGLLLWNAFFAAVAATLDDPNTSSRSSLLMLPVIPVVLSIAVIRDPDGGIARFLSLFPLTSAPALPMRQVLSDPGIVEIVLSLALLAASVWMVRGAAGRIFEIGMLMYGKEPTIAEVLRWARGAGRDR